MVTPRYQAGFLISKIQKLSRKIFNQKLKKNGIRIHPGQGRILYVLWNDGDHVPIKYLVKKTGLPKTTLTSILDRLEQESQIIRKPSSEDKRETLIILTEENKNYHPIYKKVSQEMEKIYYRGFNEEDKLKLDEYLTRILHNIQNN
jgi:MarR family transcriptional regulator, organic hydroperoxide resistance regulator